MKALYQDADEAYKVLGRGSPGVSEASWTDRYVTDTLT